MKKSVKRILCGALSLAMCSTMVLEGVLRLNADNPSSVTTATASAAFTNVTGQYDTAKLREQYFNDGVLQTTEQPVYETRTVMVTLSGKTVIERAGKERVADYLDGWSGDRAKSEIQKEQTAFLQALSKMGISYEVEHTYTNVLNAVAVKIDTKHVAEIKKMKGVESAVITTAYSVPQTVEGQSTSDGVVTNETEVYKTGIYDPGNNAKYGKGMVVAVLDTGLDYTHPAFQGFESSEVALKWDKATVEELLSEKSLAAETRSGSLEVSDVYRNDKVPFAYDYADDDADVYPSYSNHGTHVAGIIGGYHKDSANDAGYTDKDGNPVHEDFKGVVPDAQLMICKVFTDDLDDPDLGGAVSEDIVAALEDCVTLGVDVINMSLGSSCGFTTTNDGDDEGEMLNEVYESIGAAGISLICAASNDYSAGYGGVYGTNLAQNPDAGTVGSPSTFSSALSVASINGQPANYLVVDTDDEEVNPYVFFEEARDINSNELDFVKELTDAYPQNNGVFEYVLVPGIGNSADFGSVSSLFREKKRIALVKRGDTTFKEKIDTAMSYGAAGIIVYNNVAGVIRMNLGEVDDPIPAISISMNAGEAMKAGVDPQTKIGKITVSESYAAGPFMSEFSSWGPTPDLRLKPEITAHGGEITSAVPGGYGEQSGTSMATPNMAGFMAIVRSYIQDAGNTAMRKYITVDGTQNGAIDPVKVNRLAMQLTMSTAGTVYDQDGLAYSPRKQGAGVAKLENVVGGTGAFLWTDNAENDYRPKIELGDDSTRKANGEKDGEYTLRFNLTNFSDKTLSFGLKTLFMTETLAKNYLTVDEQAYMLDDSSAQWSGAGVSGKKVIVSAGATTEITVKLILSDADKKYVKDNFKNGMYVEGFVKLISDDTNESQCDLTVPFMGFYGDWYQAPMLDYSVYEVAANAQDASVLEKDKIKASVWETQPFNMYYNDKYILPMGSYLYLLPEDIPDSEKMYANEEYNAVSRYNEYYCEGEGSNYMTSTGIKAVYAGLLRNARYVKYRLIDESTGEVLKDDYMNRVAKAYAGGGSAVPANVELELDPEIEGLLANGRYRMEFEFFGEGYKTNKTGDEFEAYIASLQADEENTFAFSFTVDYDAPVMEAARVRYYDYKDGKVEKQKIYLDVDVYDNHYAQTMMLCYPKENAEEELVLQLATEYPTPIRNAVKNGVTTVSIEITDIYEEYGKDFYIQLDDYALNSCLYKIEIQDANKSVLPEGKDFALAEGESELNLKIYEEHKVSLVYGDGFKGDCNLSNFNWATTDDTVAAVKNGEIVGLSEGTAIVTVSGKGGTGNTKKITVNVSAEKVNLAGVPEMSFDVIKTDTDSLQKAEGWVKVSPGEEISLRLMTDPWYHPMTGIVVKYRSSDPEIANVDENTGKVKTLKHGIAIITATVYRQTADGLVSTAYGTTVTLNVQNEFTVSNYTLTDYNGWGYTVDDDESIKYLPEGETPLTAEDGILRIPTELNVMYIGAEAFKDNNNIKKLIIPASVIDIRERAFLNCTALEEVYFVSTSKKDIADADLAMIYENAFQGCINLKKIDFINVKTVTVAADCFRDCTKLETVGGMTKIGTMHHRAFAGTAIKSADLRGLHMSGDNVFSGCTDLTEIFTSQFTAIGKGMFSGVTLQIMEDDAVVTKSYSACTGLTAVTLHTPKIGDAAFAGCTNLTDVTLDANGTAIEFAVGENAFAGSGLTNLYFGSKETPTAQTVRSIAGGAFANTKLNAFDFANITGLEILGENAFASTKLPSSEITLIDALDFETLRLSGIPFDGLTVTVQADSQKYAQDADGVIYNKGMDEVLYVPSTFTGEDGAYILPASVKRIGDYAFANSRLTSLTLHSEVQSLGVGAFKKAKLSSIDFADAQITEIATETFAASGLTSVTLPVSVKTVGDYAFANAKSLRTFVGDGVLTVGDGVFTACIALESVRFDSGDDTDERATMGSQVFYGCTSLTSITLPSLKELGDYTFTGATKLTTVTFGENATTTGRYTFAQTPVTAVTLGEGIEEIGEGAFFDCTKLGSVDLQSATKVNELAFAGCIALKTVVNLDKVTDFGMLAFYDTAMPALTLTAAKNVGYMAFAATETAKTAAYATLSIPVVETVEDFAFFNGGISTLTIPASLKTLGAGAFASSDKLASVDVAAGNEIFFAENGVLYRNVGAEGNYELVFYPTALKQATTNGERTYSVKEGTSRVLAYSFYTLNDDTVDAVILPYSVKIIGDGAFMNSGVTKYTFESIKAPILETSYRQEVRDALYNAQDTAEYKGYYYNNFETYFFPYTSKVGTVSTLTMCYPRNGSGYTNPIYTKYFGTRTPSEVDLQEDNTRVTVNYLKGLKSLSEINAWASLPTTAENKKIVENYVEELKVIREYYNGVVSKGEGQESYISDDLVSNLLAVEEAMRRVKEHFNIPVTIESFVIADDSTHKAEYIVGEIFDISGLKVLIVYDDNSSVEADSSKFVLITTGALKTYNTYVEVGYDDETIYVPVTVTEEVVAPSPEEPEDSTTDSADSSASDSVEDSVGVSNAEGAPIDGKLLLIIAGGVVGVALVTLFTLNIAKALKKKKRKKAEENALVAEKAAQLEEFEKEYGEIHKDVLAVVYPTETQEEQEQVDRIVDELSKSFLDVPVPEGGKVIKKTKKIKK